jgi:hypothetical protein
MSANIGGEKIGGGDRTQEPLWFSGMSTCRSGTGCPWPAGSARGGSVSRNFDGGEQAEIIFKL